MKKIILFFFIQIILSSILFGNPIPEPQARISELKFEDNNNWQLEFWLTEYYDEFQFDSICIETSGGFSRIKTYNIIEDTNLFVVTSDSLTRPLSINKEGDFLKVYSFINGLGFHPKDSIAFGNWPGSTIDSIPSGYSLIRLPGGLYNYLSKDKTPTIGMPNDTSGTCGILTGHIYDKNYNLVTNGNFLLDNLLTPQNDGSYLTNISSRKVQFTWIRNFISTTSSQYVRIDTLNLNINPACQYAKDIRLLDDYVEVKENKFAQDFKISIVNYPNPFNSITNFVVRIPSSQNFKRKQLNIYDMLGKKIRSFNISDKEVLQWDGKDFNGNSVSTGTYYYQLVIENKTYKSGSIILLK